MTEEEWLTATHPQQMLEYVNIRASHRKLRLFACACCRQIWYRMTDERHVQAVEVAERHAEDLADKEELARARAATNFTRPSKIASAVIQVAEDGHCWDGNGPWMVAAHVGFAAGVDAYDAVQAKTVELLRHIVGNPFYPHPPPLPHVPAAVRNLAEPVYQQAQANVGPLHDVLLDAGLTELADHFRNAAERHPKGCWALDILTGRG